MNILNRDQMISRDTAVHEAAHCVACRAMELERGFRRPRFEGVWVVTPEEIRKGTFLLDGEPVACEGAFGCGSPWSELPRDPNDRRAGRRWIEDFVMDAIFTCAGPAAQAQFQRRGFAPVFRSPECRNDYDRIKYMVGLHEVGGGNRAHFLNAFVDAAHELLAQDQVWTAVNALADALQERHSIMANQVVEIVDPLLAGKLVPILRETCARVFPIRPEDVASTSRDRTQRVAAAEVSFIQRRAARRRSR